MSRVLFGAFLVAFLAASGDVFSPAASQAWVTNYISQVMGGFNRTSKDGVTTIVSGDITLSVEELTDAALRVKSVMPTASALGVTNGMYFVWNGEGQYINPVAVVTSTRTNMVFAGVGSTFTNGLLHFEGMFDADAVAIQRSTSLSVTNGVGGVR